MAGGTGRRDPLLASEIHGFLTCAGRPARPPLERGFSVSPPFVFLFRTLRAEMLPLLLPSAMTEDGAHRK